MDTNNVTPIAATLLENNPQLKLLRDKGIAAYQDGTLFIAESYVTDSGVVSLQAYCKKNNYRINKEIVTLDKVSEINNSTVSSEVGISNDSKSKAIQTFHEITRIAAQANASDIHIISGKNGAIIKHRVNGDLITIPVSLTSEDGDLLRSAIYTNLTSIAGRSYMPSKQQDAIIPIENLSRHIQKKVNAIRVATTPLDNGGLMVLRLLYDTGLDNANSLSDLGYTEKQISIIEKKHSTGITLIVGPTGSGKSTTLKIILSALNIFYDGRKHIMSVEDPPEYSIPGVNQIPVANMETTEDRDAVFNGVVRASLRLDPDIIMIGEIRDLVTAIIALNAAMTGHDVWATLHANTPLGAVQRLVLMGVNINLMAGPSDFRGVVSQRLVKILCPTCKISFKQLSDHPQLYERLLRSGTIGRLTPIIESYENDIHFRGVGCAHCNETGIKGRSVIAEIFENTRNSKVMELLIAQKWPQARAQWLAEGNKTMMMHAIELIKQGLVDPRDVEDILDEIYYEEVAHV